MLQSIIAYIMTLGMGVFAICAFVEMMYRAINAEPKRAGNLFWSFLIFGAFAFLFAYVAGI